MKSALSPLLKSKKLTRLKQGLNSSLIKEIIDISRNDYKYSNNGSKNKDINLFNESCRISSYSSVSSTLFCNELIHHAIDPLPIEDLERMMVTLSLVNDENSTIILSKYIINNYKNDIFSNSILNNKMELSSNNEHQLTSQLQDNINKIPYVQTYENIIISAAQQGIY
jgi:hypothetical protein